MEQEILAIILQYISIPVGMILVLLALYSPARRVKILKYEFSSAALLLIAGVLLVLLAFPVAQFIASLKTAVFKSAASPK